MARQVEVGLDDSEHDLLLERAAEWGRETDGIREAANVGARRLRRSE